MEYSTLHKNLNFVDVSKNQKMQLMMLIDDHNNKKISLYQKTNLLEEQIKIGLEDIYVRFYRCLNELTPKDSSSKKSYILKYGEVEGLKRFNEKTSKSKHNLSNYIKRYGEVEGTRRFDDYKKTKSCSLDNCIRRYGEVQGRIYYEQYWKNTTFGISKEKYIRKYGEEYGVLEFDKLKKLYEHRYTKSWFIEKYGDDGVKRWKQFHKNRAEKCRKDVFVNNLLKKGHTDNEISHEIKKRWNHVSLDSFIKRYGEVEGTRRFDDYKKTKRKNMPNCIEYYKERGIEWKEACNEISKIQLKRRKNIKCVSKESMQILIPLSHMFEDVFNQQNLKFGEKNEHAIPLTEEEHFVANQYNFYYDFTIPDMNIIIEYHGERFHKKYNYDITLSLDFEYFKDRYDKDLFKKWIAEQRGYQVIILRSWKIKEDLLYLKSILQQKGDISGWEHLFF